MLPTNETERRMPTAIDLDRENGLMQIAWADGHASLYEVAVLRRLCPCAHCSGEGSRPGTIDDTTIFSARQVMLEAVQPLNRFGLQFIWADGHDHGFYSYAYLRDLCPCDDCVAAYISRP